MSKHTPGPWILSETSVLRYGDTLPTKICEIFCSNNNKVICEIPDYRYHTEYDASDRADAYLLTAAPDLLSDLCLAADILRKYETLHRAKNTEESTAKAEVNADLASRFESTISRARGEA